MTEYRTGNHWGVTIVREGTQPVDATGHRPDAQLVAVITNGDRKLAERICALLNGPQLVKRDWVLDNSPQLTEWLNEQSARRGRPRPVDTAESATCAHCGDLFPLAELDGLTCAGCIDNPDAGMVGP